MNAYKLVYDSVFETDFINHILPAVARQKALRKNCVAINFTAIMFFACH
jgi:hypothetical protein